MNTFSYKIHEILNAAIMTRIPVIIVEGIDDTSIYEKIASNVSFDIEVYPVENIDGFSGGSNQVIQAIENLNTIECGEHELSSHILGIIDKDVRDFEGNVPKIEPLLMLNYYSIESHFVSKSVISEILTIVSKMNKALIRHEFCDAMLDEVESNLMNLYYFSLESLKKALNPDYSGCFSYRFPAGRIKDQTIKQAVMNKRKELDEFASTLRLNPCLDTLKIITKGKWLIESFSSELFASIGKLQEKCRQGVIVSCMPCRSQEYEKCLYRLKKGFMAKTIESIALSSVGGVEFDYIVNRLSRIKQSA